MRKVLLAFLTILCCQLVSYAQKIEDKTCSNAYISFPCPDEYKILFNRHDKKGIFLAKSSTFSYSLFVISENNAKKLNFSKNYAETILKKIYPEESQKYDWKKLKNYRKNPTSKYEVEKQLINSFNGYHLLTIEFNQIKFNGKFLIIGTVVEGFRKKKEARKDFLTNRYTTNGGCYDAEKIHQFITKEEKNTNYNYCVGFTLKSK